MYLYPPSQARLSPASSNMSITLLWAAVEGMDASQDEKVPSQQSRAFNQTLWLCEIFKMFTWAQVYFLSTSL